MYCKKCGTKLKEGEKYCHHCGAKVDETIHMDPNGQTEAPEESAKALEGNATEATSFVQNEVTTKSKNRRIALTVGGIAAAAVVIVTIAAVSVNRNVSTELDNKSQNAAVEAQVETESAQIPEEEESAEREPEEEEAEEPAEEEPTEENQDTIPEKKPGEKWVVETIKYGDDYIYEYEYNDDYTTYKMNETYYDNPTIRKSEEGNVDDEGNLQPIKGVKDLGVYGIYDGEYTYDENGNVLSEIWYLDGQMTTIGTKFYTYDENGNLITYSVTGGSDGTLGKYEYTYDENGNCLSELYYWGMAIEKDGIYDVDPADIYFEYQYEYTYDENGNKVSMISYDESGNKIKETEYFYDVHGNQLSEGYYDESGDKVVTGEYTYDDHGNLLIEESLYNAYPRIEYTYTQVY